MTQLLLLRELWSQKNRIYVFKEWGGTGYLNDEIAEQINLWVSLNPAIKADAAEQKSIG